MSQLYYFNHHRESMINENPMGMMVIANTTWNLDFIFGPGIRNTVWSMEFNDFKAQVFFNCEKILHSCLTLM